MRNGRPSSLAAAALALAGVLVAVGPGGTGAWARGIGTEDSGAAGALSSFGRHFSSPHSSDHHSGNDRLADFDFGLDGEHHPHRSDFIGGSHGDPVSENDGSFALFSPSGDQFLPGDHDDDNHPHPHRGDDDHAGSSANWSLSFGYDRGEDHDDDYAHDHGHDYAHGHGHGHGGLPDGSLLGFNWTLPSGHGGGAPWDSGDPNWCQPVSDPLGDPPPAPPPAGPSAVSVPLPASALLYGSALFGFLLLWPRRRARARLRR